MSGLLMSGCVEQGDVWNDCTEIQDQSGMYASKLLCRK